MIFMYHLSLLYKEQVNIMTFETVYARELAMYVRENDSVVVDIRLPGNYEECHWQQAVNLPFEFTDDYEQILDKGQSIVFYCEHGGSSMQLARYLGRRGYKTATVIGGYEAMKKFDEKCLKKSNFVPQ